MKSMDVKRELTDAEIEELGAQEAELRIREGAYGAYCKLLQTYCEACGGDGTVLLTDGYKGQVIATAKCIYCNGTGRVNKERER